MPEIPKQIIIVTPVWNDSTRLARYGASLAPAFAEADLPIRWVIADHGSDDHEHDRLKKLHADFLKIFPNIDLHFAQKHFGKGSVVREAWELHPEAEWLAFVDADGSVTAADLLRLVRHAVNQQQSVLGIRKRTASTHVVESPWRAIFHRGFLLCAHLILHLEWKDPQCCVNILRGDDYRSIVKLDFEFIQP